LVFKSHQNEFQKVQQKVQVPEVLVAPVSIQNYTVAKNLVAEVIGAQNIAVVHEWLSVNAGSEKVTECIINLFEDVDVFSTVDFLSPKDRKSIVGNRKPHTSFVQKLPWARRHFRYYLPIFPFAVRSHNLENYPIIISSSHAFAHGIKKKKNQLHISYCHTPMRYIWDMQNVYLEAHKINIGPLGWASKVLTYFFRKWDAKVSQNVDYYISNSSFTAQRIRKFYGKKAHVIYPPVNIDRFEVEAKKEEFYVTASRLVCYKKVDLVVAAFTKMPDKKLIVIGDGNEKARIEKMAGPNITILSHLEFEKFHHYMRKAKAFVFAGKEDFGITLVEAQACGTPIIAYKKGGAGEIVKNRETGLLFNKQSVDEIIGAVQEFEANYEKSFIAEDIRKNAERFSLERFNTEMMSFVNTCIQEKYAR
jgi:glycosyltransferase involved in cell wall biosynthesis